VIRTRRHLKCCWFTIAQWPVVYPALVTCDLHLFTPYWIAVELVWKPEILDSASVHAKEQWFQHDFCNRAKLHCAHRLLSGESQQIGVHDIQDSFLCRHKSLYGKYIVWTFGLKDHLSDQASKLYSYFKTYISSVSSLIFSLFAWAAGVSLLWLTAGLAGGENGRRFLLLKGNDKTGIFIVLTRMRR